MQYYIDPITAQAIKKYPHRTRDIVQSFDEKQLKCKQWLYDELKGLNIRPRKKIYVAGSWFGNILVPYLRDLYKDTEIRLHDIDEEVIKISKGVYFRNDELVKPEVVDATKYEKYKDMVINTSCEHIPSLSIREGSIVVLQSNDYREISEHINCVDSPEQLADQYGVKKIYYSGELEFEKYTRFMIIGTV